MKMADEKELQKKYMQFQALNQQLQQVQQQLQAIDAQLLEMRSTEESLREIGKTDAGKEILIPVANGIFAKAELKDNKNLLLNVGSDTVVKKTVDESVEMIKKQFDEVSKYRYELIEQLQKFSVYAQKTQDELEKMMG